MEQTDSVKIYAAMDQRIVVKYELPRGEQIGKRVQQPIPQTKTS